MEYQVIKITMEIGKVDYEKNKRVNNEPINFSIMFPLEQRPFNTSLLTQFEDVCSKLRQEFIKEVLKDK